MERFIKDTGYMLLMGLFTFIWVTWLGVYTLRHTHTHKILDP